MFEEIQDTTCIPHSKRVYSLDTFTDVMKYWSELEFISLHKILEEEEEESTSSLDRNNLPRTLPDVQNPNNWKVAKHLTRGHRVLLDKHNPTAEPLSKDECAKVARACHLSTSQVAMYYRR
jgi:hypothetical protein